MFHLFGCFILAFILVGSATTTTRASEASRFSVDKASEETISGNILSIDQTTGIITVETATGVVNLEAAPEAITAWKEGDPVIVKINRAEQLKYGEVPEERTAIPRNRSATKSGAVLSR